MTIRFVPDDDGQPVRPHAGYLRLWLAEGFLQGHARGASTGSPCCRAVCPWRSSARSGPRSPRSACLRRPGRCRGAGSITHHGAAAVPRRHRRDRGGTVRGRRGGSAAHGDRCLQRARVADRAAPGHRGDRRREDLGRARHGSVRQRRSAGAPPCTLRSWRQSHRPPASGSHICTPTRSSSAITRANWSPDNARPYSPTTTASNRRPGEDSSASNAAASGREDHGNCPSTPDTSPAPEVRKRSRPATAGCSPKSSDTASEVRRTRGLTLA